MSEQAQVAQTGEPTTFSADYVKELRGENAQWRTKLREAEERLSAIEAAASTKEQEESAKRGEFETLYKTAQQEKEEAAKKLKEHEAQLAKYRERDENEFKSLLEKVPEKLRSHLDDSIPLEKRIALAKDLSSNSVQPPKAGLPGETPATTYEEDVKNAKTSSELDAVLRKHGKT